MICSPTRIVKKGQRLDILMHHKCGMGTCYNCEHTVRINSHQCYIQPIDHAEDEPKKKKKKTKKTKDSEEPPKPKPPPLFVYADYEAVTDSEGVQTPIIICAETEDCDETEVFYGEDCTEDFFELLDNLTITDDGDERKVIVLFRNFQGYDSMFIQQYLHRFHREVTDQITVGVKVLSLTSGNLVFKDSLCFLPFPLSAFPSTFALTELKKGFFPHLFNTIQNQEYEGPMPPREYYDPDGMSQKKKAEFEEWYHQQVTRNHVFNLRNEMEEYCISDVKLLKAGCMAFQREFKHHGKFNPMEKCVTIASACNRYWRKMLLPKNTIAVEPPRGWHGARTNQSIKAFKWLAWCEHQLRRVCSSTGEPMADRIHHAGNGGEQAIQSPAGLLHVDGYDPSSRTIYEFHGCLWHGCPRCFKHNRHSTSKIHPARTLEQVYEATCKKINLLKHLGYTVIEQWECNWDQKVKIDLGLQDFLSTLDLVHPLSPRDAFFGGRTNAATLYYKADETQGEQIKYVDVTSLYPWVNKYGEYPIGHPKIITHHEDQNISNYFGIANVDILPPFHLYHPVLPYRCGGKLVLPLCRSCVEQQMSKPLLERSFWCSHSPTQRMLRGTWCTPELQKAVEMGYTLVKIHEVWHFPQSQRSKGLFANYVNQWLKIKQESSGYPAWAQTELQRQQYVRHYKEREGIALSPALIGKNPGRKATAKLMLNSFWGKFGVRLNKPRTVTIASSAELFTLVNNNMINISTIRICTEDVLEVVYTHVQDEEPQNGKTNIFVAAFTTCLARLKLYESLEILGERALYFDTDSVIYRCKPGEADIPLGDFLGDMTNELDNGDYITEFVSGGPKNYGYQTANGKICCKVRGFTLNVRGSKQLNYHIMRQNVLEEITDPLEEQRRNIEVVNPHFFTRDPVSKCLKVIPRTKKYGLVFDKRIIDPSTFQSYPYGFSTPGFDEQDEDMAELLLDL